MGGGTGTGDRAEEATAETARRAETTWQTTQQKVGKTHQARRGAIDHDGAGEYEQRQREIGKRVDAVHHLLHDDGDGNVAAEHEEERGTDTDGEADGDGERETDHENNKHPTDHEAPP